MVDAGALFEQDALASWPPLQSSPLVAGWTAGLSGGTSNRANCAWSEGSPSPVTEEVLGAAARFYASAGRQALVRVRTREVPGAVDAAEQAWGTCRVANPTLVRAATGGAARSAGDPRVVELDREAWLIAHAVVADDHDAAFVSIVRAVCLPTTYLALLDSGPVGVVRMTAGRTAFGLHSLAVTEAARGQGLGRLLTDVCLQRAAGPVYLHVDADNDAANRLYDAAGLEVVGSYGYLTP